MKQHKFNIYLTDYIQKNTTNTESMISEQIILNTKSRRYVRLSDLKSRKKANKKTRTFIAWLGLNRVFSISQIYELKSVEQKMIKKNNINCCATFRVGKAGDDIS